MSDRPILFSAPMILALLAGRKTQTRRMLKPQPPEGARYSGIHYASYEPSSHFFNCEGRGFKVLCRVEEGDALWVRETWAPLSALKHNDPGTQAIVDRGFYRADCSVHDDEIDKWRPSIFMPRTISRLTLIVEDVRVERLQDISEEDAIAEGIEAKTICGVGDVWTHYGNPSAPVGWKDPRQSYQTLWDSINGAGSWAADPWIGAYTFRVIPQNIDRIVA